MWTSSACKFIQSAAVATLLARHAAAQTTPVRNLELEGNADAAGFTILNLPGQFVDDIGAARIETFNTAVGDLNARLDGLELDASPDLMTVAKKGDHADSLRVLRVETLTHEGTNIVGGSVSVHINSSNQVLGWDGAVFRNIAGTYVLGFGRDRVFNATYPVNPLAPTDRWLLLESGGYLDVGPGGDLPAGPNTGGLISQYDVGWRYQNGAWGAYAATPAQVLFYDYTLAEGVVTNTVETHEPVAVVAEVEAVAGAVATLGAELAGLPRTLRGLAALDDRADSLRVLRTNLVPRVAGGENVAGVKAYGNELPWDGSRFYGSKVESPGSLTHLLVGYGPDAVLIPGMAANPLAPAGTWLLNEVVEIGGMVVAATMAAGPADAAPCGPTGVFTYTQSWGYNGSWFAFAGNSVALTAVEITTPTHIVVDEVVAHEPVATLGDLHTFTDLVTGQRASLVLSNANLYLVFDLQAEAP